MEVGSILTCVYAVALSTPVKLDFLYVGKLTVSEKDGSDAKSYQEKAVREAIQEVQQKQGNE
jgi:hypothetical protein